MFVAREIMHIPPRFLRILFLRQHFAALHNLKKVNNYAFQNFFIKSDL